MSISPPSRSPPSLPGASPDTMASSVATPLEQQFAAIPASTQMTSTSGLGATSITLQFDLDPAISTARRRTCRRRSMPPAGCCRRICPTRRPIGRPTRPTAPILIYAVYVRRAADLQGRRLRLHDPGAAALDRARASPRSSSPASRNMRSHIQVNPGALASRGIGLEDVRTALANATLDEPKGNLESAHQAVHPRHQRPALQRRKPSQGHRRLSQRRAGARQGRRRRGQFGAEQPRRRLVQQQASRAAADPARSPAPTPSRWSIASRR